MEAIITFQIDLKQVLSDPIFLVAYRECEAKSYTALLDIIFALGQPSSIASERAAVDVLHYWDFVCYGTIAPVLLLAQFVPCINKWYL